MIKALGLKYFKEHSDWTKVWSGKWGFHSCSHFGYGWSTENLVSGKPVYPLIIYITRKGITDCWVPKKDKDDLCERLMAEIKNNPNRVSEIAGSLKLNSDTVLSFIGENVSKKIDINTYDQLWQKIFDYYLPHVCVKYIVDYFNPEDLKKYLPILEEARLYAEPVFREQENFMERIADGIAQETGLTRNIILCTSGEELRKYFKTSKLPQKSELEKRFLVSAQFFELGKSRIFSGGDAVEAEKIVLPNADRLCIKGQIAYKGKTAGQVRIVIDPFKYKGFFKKGDILVTGMTRPEFLPLMKKAGAIVTDAGGILSHAAITAREMKKPCIIGTQIATKLLKDGDIVEVDANSGIVKIIKV